MAIGASFAALLIFFWMRSRPAEQVLIWQTLASVVMGSAIISMHYTGMAAADFPLGSICRSAYGVNTQWLGYALGGFSFLFLTTTLITALLDARLQAHIAALNKSLDTANHELLQSALRDPLTLLPNRLIFENYLDHMASQVSRSGGQFAIMLVNLDGFKLINDTLGYQSGDEVLKQVAHRMQEQGRASDTIARIGGDDFIVLADTEGQLETATALASHHQYHRRAAGPEWQRYFPDVFHRHQPLPGRRACRQDDRQRRCRHASIQAFGQIHFLLLLAEHEYRHGQAALHAARSQNGDHPPSACALLPTQD
jgi:GGDEF domain-containing protein